MHFFSRSLYPFSQTISLKGLLLCFTLGVVSIAELGSWLDATVWLYRSLAGISMILLGIYFAIFCARRSTLLILSLSLISFALGLYLAHKTVVDQRAILWHLADSVDSHSGYLKDEVEVLAEVVSLPVMSGNAIRAVVRLVCEPRQECFYGKRRVLLKWHSAPIKALDLAGLWRLKVKLRAPRGLVNPVGFDYEKWLFQQSISAVGTIEAGEPVAEARLSWQAYLQVLRSEFKQGLLADVLSVAPEMQSRELVSIGEYSARQPDSSSFDNQRQNQNQYKKLPEQIAKALFFALSMGDRSYLTPSHWQTLSATQTSHLISISGLHVSLVMGVGLLVLNVLLRICVSRSRVLLKPFLYPIGLLLVGFYVLLAGLSYPTQRAFFMVSVLFLPVVFGGRLSLWTCLFFAAAVILLLQPLAMLSAGFWMSCLAVAGIALVVQGRMEWRARPRFTVLISLIRFQTLIYLLMVPVSLSVFSVSSVWGLLANFIAIPLISFMIMPYLLFCLLSFFVLGSDAAVFFDLLLRLLEIYWIVIEFFAQLEQTQFKTLPRFNFLLLTLAVLCLASPLLFRVRVALIAVLLIASCAAERDPAIPSNQLKVVVFDVGQGTSILLQTQHHQLLYDTGTRFPSGFNMMDAAVLPYLQSEQRPSLDLLMVSHSDLDHRGGLNAVLDAGVVSYVMADDWYRPEPGEGSNRLHCLDGLNWQWDQVEFTVRRVFSEPLDNGPSDNEPSNYKDEPQESLSDNNQSCLLEVVLQDSLSSYRLLLTGDIEAEAEQLLLDDQSAMDSVDWLLVPHHGSKTSSSIGFLNRVKPTVAVVSAGFNNAFGHPSQVVVDRYEARGTQVFNTANSGALEFLISPKGISSLTARRLHQPPFWRQ